MALGTALSAPALYPLAAVFGLPGLAIGLVLAGFLEGPVDVALLTLRQRRTDPAWLGRVLAVSISLNLSGFPLGSALGGWVAAASPALACALAGLAALVAALAVWTLVPPASLPHGDELR